MASAGEAFLLDEEETAQKSGKGGCTGSVAAPTAPRGKLCVYTAEEEYKTLNFAPEIVAAEEHEDEFGRPGTFIKISVGEGGRASAYGVWAVTAP